MDGWDGNLRKHLFYELIQGKCMGQGCQWKWDPAASRPTGRVSHARCLHQPQSHRNLHRGRCWKLRQSCKSGDGTRWKSWQISPDSKIFQQPLSQARCHHQPQPHHNLQGVRCLKMGQNLTEFLHWLALAQRPQNQLQWQLNLQGGHCWKFGQSWWDGTCQQISPNESKIYWATWVAPTPPLLNIWEKL